MPNPPDVSPHHAPARVLGLYDTTSVVIGAIIGIGIFFTPSRVASLTGSGALTITAWVVGGAIAMMGALAFARLGRAFTGPGAQYEVLSTTFGKLPAFLFVFCNATAVQGGAIGVIAWLCASNLSVAISAGPASNPALLALSVALIAGVTTANALGVRAGAGIQNVTVASKLLTLVGVALLAAWAGRADPLAAIEGAPRRVTPMVGLLAALVPVFFSYGGWQHALWISGEVKEPERTLPRAILVGVAIVVAVYVTANLAYLRLLGPDAMAESRTLAADAVAAVWPDIGRRVVAGAVAISAFGVLNAQLLSGPRLVHAMAADGLFFRPFARLGARTGAPTHAILLLGLAGVSLLLAAGFEGVDRLTTGVVLVDGIFLGLTGAAVIVRFLAAKDRRPRDGLYAIAASLFVIGEIGIVVGAHLDPATRAAALIGLAWIAGAAVVYALFFRRATPAAAS